MDEDESDDEDPSSTATEADREAKAKEARMKKAKEQRLARKALSTVFICGAYVYLNLVPNVFNAS